MKTAFHVVYTVLALNFAIPVLFYIFDPAGSIANFAMLGDLFGYDYPWSEQSILWRVLAIANVATLSFCCVLLQIDLKKWFAVLVPLIFLKGTASVGFGVAFLIEGHPTFLGGFLLDLVTCLAMWFFATRAHRAIAG